MHPRYKEWLEHPITEAVLRELEVGLMEHQNAAAQAFINDPLDPPDSAIRSVFFVHALSEILNEIKEGNIDLSTQ
jgi:hypothetical protein